MPLPNYVLVQRQSLPLNAKIRMTLLRIQEWYEYWEGSVYISYSGGLDSTVLRHLVLSRYPEVPCVFSNTGLEYPEIVAHVNQTPVVTIRPTVTFAQVIKDYGYPIISKETAMKMDRIRANGLASDSAILFLLGIRSDGVECPRSKLPEKWHFLVDAPFLISDKCCDWLKKRPFKQYEKQTGRHPYAGTRADESQLRRRVYNLQGCNAFTNNHPISMPLAFWKHEDILEYIKRNQIPYCCLYDRGESRTGCMFCMFGVHLEKQPNRFQRMRLSHPKQWDYCINKLGCGKVLDYIKVPY